MQLNAITMSRVVAITGIGELNPYGRVFLPSLIPAIVKRYNFQKYPTKVEELNLSDGVTFEAGYDDEFGTVAKLIAYNNGLTIEMLGPSASTKATIIKMYEWLSAEHGLTFNETVIRRWYYVTGLRFTSTVDLTNLHPALKLAINVVREQSLSVGRVDVPFSTTKFYVDYDHGRVEFPQAAFVLQRDPSATFEENKYFSESPLPSEKHIALLEDMERSVIENATQ